MNNVGGPGANAPISINQNTVMAILAYIGPLVLVPYFTAKADPVVKFHVGQGLVLFAIEVILWILGMILWPLWMLLWLVNIAVWILAIIGVINAAQGQQKKLPVVGDFSKYFRI